MLCPNTLAASITAIAVAIAEGKTPEELDLLSAIFMQLADTLATISAQKTIYKYKMRQTPIQFK